MPIYAKGYKALGADERPGRPSLLTLPATEVRRYFKDWKSMVLLLVCMGPQIVRLVQVILVASFPDMPMGGGRRRAMAARAADFLGSPDTVEFYAEFLLQLPVTMILVGVYVAATSIHTVSRDRRWGALELYFTRPLRRWHYIAGRWIGASTSVALVTTLPLLLVWLIAALIAPDWQFLLTTWRIPLVFAVQGVFLCGFFGLLIVAISSLAATSRTCQVIWMGFLLIMHTVFSGGLRRFIHEDWPVAFSPWGVVQRISEAILGVEPEHPSLALVGAWVRTPVEWVRTGLFGLEADPRLAEASGVGCVETAVLLLVAAWLVLRRTLKPVEVVG